LDASQDKFQHKRIFLDSLVKSRSLLSTFFILRCILILWFYIYKQLRLSINYIVADFPTKISCDFLISNMRETKRYSSGRCLEVINSNCDPDTDYNSRGIPWFSSATPRKFRGINLGYATNASSKSKNLLISYPFIFYSAEIRAVLFLCFIHELLLINYLLNKLTNIVNLQLCSSDTAKHLQKLSFHVCFYIIRTQFRNKFNLK